MDEYQGYYADCYILTEKRNGLELINFLNYFIPNNEISTDEFEIPQYGNGITQSFDNSQNLISHLVDSVEEPYYLYYRNLEKSDIIGAMCYFTKDCGMIFGLSTETKYPNTTIEDEAFKNLKSYFNSSLGYITYENPPPNTHTEFLEIVNNFTQ